MKPFQEELLRQVRERETAPPPVDIKKDAAILKVGRPDRLDRAVAPIPTEQQAPTRQAPPVENRLPALTGKLPISSAARSLASPDLALSPDMRDSDIDSFAKAEPQRRLREVGTEWHPGLADEVDPTLGRNLRQTMAAAYSQGHKLLLRADDPPAELQLDRLAREIQQEAAAGATSATVGASQGTRIAAHARSLKMSPESFRAQVKAWDPNFDLDAMEDAAKDGPVYLSWKQVEARDQAIANAAAAKEKAANERRLRVTEKASRGELEGNIVRSAREAAEQSRARTQAELESLGVTGPELARAFDDSVTYQTMLENTLKTVGLSGKSTTTERKLSAIRDYNQAQSKFLQVQARTFEAVRDQTQKDRATVAVGTPHVLSGTASALGDDYRDTAVNLSPTEGHDAAVRILTSWSIDSDWAIAEVNNTTMTNATADILIDKYMQAALRANTLAPGDDVGRFRREMLAVIGGLMIPGNYGGAVFLSQDGSSAVHDDAYGKGFLAHLGQTAEDMAPRYQLVGITKVDGVYKPVLRPESMATWLGSAVADTPQAMTAGAAKVVAEWVYNPNSRDLTLDDLLEGSRRGLRDRTDAFEFGQEYQDEYYGTALKMAKWGLENKGKFDAELPSWWFGPGVENLPDADTLAAVATANFVALTMLGAVASPGTPEAVLTAAGKLAKTAKVAGAAASTASATQRAGRYIDRVFPGSAARRTLDALDESAEGALDSARAIRQGDAQAASLLEAQAGTDRVLQKGAPAVRGAVDRFVSDQIVEASRYDQANADARDVDLADALPGEARNQRASLHTGARKEDIKADLKMTGESGRRFGSRLESIDGELGKADAAGRKAGDFITHADGLPRIRASLDKSLFDVSRKLRVVADPQAELAAPGKAKMRPFLRRLAQYEDAMTDPARWLREVSRDVEDLAVLDHPAVAASLSLKHPKKTAQEIDELASKTIVRRRKVLRRQLKQWHRQMRIARFQADPVYALNRARQALLAEVDAVAMGNLVVGEIAAKTGYLPTLQDVGGVPAATDVGAARLARPKTAIGRIRDVLSNPKRVLSRGAGDWVQLLTDSFGMNADEATELARVEDRRAAYAARSKGVTVDAWWTKRIGDAKAAQVQAATDMATALRSGPLNGAVSRADDLHQALRQSRAWRAAAEDSGLLRLLEEMGTTIVSLDELAALLDDGPVVASRRALFSQAERPEAVRVLQAMADALKATGLETSTALAFADRVAGGKADASFVKGLIEIGLDQDPKAQLGAFHHELVHGLRAEGILDDAAWSVLDANAEAWLDDVRLASGGQTVRQRNARLNLSPEALREEAVADAYRAWKEGRLSDAGGSPTGPMTALPTGIVGIFERISAFFDGIRRWLAGGGYRNAEDVFKAIAEGRIEAEGLQRLRRDRAPSAARSDARSGTIPDGEAPTESNVKLMLDDGQTHARRGDYDFNPVGRDEASAFLAKHHYAGGAGNTMSLALGMRDKSGELVGVAWWQAPGSPNVARWAAQQYVLPNGTAVQPNEVVTLSRLAVAPGQPTNAASMLIGQSLRQLRQAGRAGAKPFKVALTYADGLERHVGGIYQATNWKYTGESRARPRWTDSNGKMVAAKATENRTFAEMEAQGLTRAEGQPKQRYVIAIDPRLQFVGPDAGPPPKQSARRPLFVPGEAFDPEKPFEVAGVKFDPVDGAGSVGHQGNINYMGFVVWMRPEEFLALNPPRTLEERASSEFLAQAMDDGKPIGPPIMYVEESPEGFRVADHEGRGRMMTLHNRAPDALVPVYIKGGGRDSEKRARHFDPDSLLRSKFVPEGSTKDGQVKARPVAISRITLNKQNYGAPVDDYQAATGKLYSSRAVEQTPEFEKWSEGLPVIDAGAPLPEGGVVVRAFHGTTEDFDRFDTFRGQLGQHFGGRDAADYAAMRREDSPLATGGASVMPVYVRLAKPARLSDSMTWTPDSVLRDIARRKVLPTDTVKKLSKEIGDKWDSIDPEEAVYGGHKQTYREHLGLIRGALQDAGYDSVVYHNYIEGDGDSYIAFSPEQVKSVNNRGTFDPSDPRILFSSRTIGRPAAGRSLPIGTGPRPMGSAQTEGWDEVDPVLRPLTRADLDTYFGGPTRTMTTDLADAEPTVGFWDRRPRRTAAAPDATGALPDKTGDLPDRKLSSRARVPRMASTFSGGGTLEEGLRWQVDPVYAVEMDPDIAAHYAKVHGDHIQTGKVQDADMSKAKGADYLHASPVCKTSSQAKIGQGEVPLDLETARAAAKALAEVRPKVFTVENVAGYAKTEAFKVITDELTKQGYTWDQQVYDAADYGAPTHRSRLLVRAKMDGPLPPQPAPTHGPGRPLPHADWFQAIEDLVDDLPPAKIAAWQLPRLAHHGVDLAKIDKPLLVMGGSTNKVTLPHAFAGGPAPAIKATPAELHRLVLPDGTVKALTPRALARISGMPDSFTLPDNRILARTIIGNGIPPALTQAVFGPLVAEVSGRTRALERHPADKTPNQVGPIHWSMGIDEVEDILLRVGGDTEHSVVFDTDGRQVSRMASLADKTQWRRMPAAERQALQDLGLTPDYPHAKSMVLVPKDLPETGKLRYTHYHPSGRHLSVEDILTCLRGNFEEIRAVGKNGTFSLTRTKGPEWQGKLELPELRRYLELQFRRIADPARMRMDAHIVAAGGKPGDASHPAFSQALFDQFLNEEFNNVADSILEGAGLNGSFRWTPGDPVVLPDEVGARAGGVPGADGRDQGPAERGSVDRGSVDRGQAPAVAPTGSPLDMPGNKFSSRATETPEFKAWFGQSSLKDPTTGEPQVLFHAGANFKGKPDDDQIFRTRAEQAEAAGEEGDYASGYPGGNLGEGYYLAFDKDYAKRFGNPEEFYVRAEKILDTDDPKVQRKINDMLDQDENGEYGDHRIFFGHQGEAVDALMDDGGYDAVVGTGVGGFSYGARELKVRDPNQIKSVENVGTWSRDDDRILYSSRAPAFKGDPGLPPGFYSGLRRAVEGIKQERLTPEQFAGILGKAAVKADEIAWTRLGDFLEGKRSVTKTELLEWLDENAVSVKERVLSDDLSNSKEARRLQQTIEEVAGRSGWEPIAVDLRQGHLADARYELDNLIEETEFEHPGVYDDWYDDLRDQFGAIASTPGTKYTQYTLPGGTNQREFLFKLPDMERAAATKDAVAYREKMVEKYGSDPVDPWYTRMSEAEGKEWERIVERSNEAGRRGPPYTAPHFNGPDAENLLLHFRVNDRVGPKGERLLHIEEVQSDWHEKGRKDGYTGGDTISALQRESDDAQAALDAWWSVNTQGPPPYDMMRRANRANDQLLAANARAVASAPFSKTWHEVALKRALRIAAEEGYDGVTWTKGIQQVERYSDDLRQKVDSLDWQAPKIEAGDLDELRAETIEKGRLAREAMDAGDPVAAAEAQRAYIATMAALRSAEGADYFGVHAMKDNRVVQTFWTKPDGTLVTPVEMPNGDRVTTLAAVIGKENAETILKRAADEASGSLSGDDLTVGGEGLKGFYDKMLTSAMGKIAKKFGGRVGETTLSLAHDASLNEPFENRGRATDILNRGGEVYGVRRGQEELLETLADLEGAEAEDGPFDAYVMGDKQPGAAVHHIAITPAMRADILDQGLPLFSRRSGPLELPNASTSFLDDGRAVVRGLQDPNIADAIHEFAHVIRQDMPPADIDAIVKWVQHRGIKIDGVDPVSGKFIPTYRNPNGTRISRADQAKATIQAEELFAQGSDAFLRGLAGGTTNRAASLLPKDKDSRSALLNISAWVSQQASGSAVSIPSPVLEVYQRAFDVLPPKPGPVRASPKRAMDMGQTNDLGQPRLHLKEHAQGTSADKLALGDTWAGAAAIDESRPSEVLRNLATMRGRADTKYESVREGLGNISRLLFSRPSPDKMPWGGFFLGGDPDTDVRQLPPYVRDVSRMGPRWITAVQGDMGALLAQRTRASYERTLDLLAGERNVLLPDGSRALSDDYAYIDEPVQSLLLWFGRALKSNPDGAQALLGMNWGLDADAWSKQEPDKAKALGLLIKTIFDAEGGVPFLAEAQKSLSTLPTSSEVDHVSSAKRLGMALQVILDPKLTKREMTAGIVDALAGPQHILGTPPPQAFNANDRVRLVVLLGSFGGYRRGLDVVAQADVGVTAADAAEYKRWLHGGESDNPEKMNDLMRRFGLYPYFQKVEMLSSLPGSGLWLPQAALDRMNTALRKAIPDLHDSKEGVAYWLAHLVQLKKAEQTRGLIRIRPEYYLANTAGSGAQTATVLGLREGATQMATLMADTALLSIPAVGHALGAFDAVAGSITGQRKLAEATRRVFLRAGDRVRHGMQMLLHPTEFSSYAVIDRLKLFDGADEPILLRSGQPLMHKGKPLTYAKLRTIAVSMGTAADFEHAEMTATLGSIIQDAQRKLPAHLQPGVRGKVQDAAQSSAAVARDWLQGVTVDTVRRTSKNFSEAERFGLIAALVERGVPPEKAGWLTTYVLFDFGGTGTPTERSSLVGLIYPYAVYQKNANAMGFDALFDPSRVYRMNVARRWAQKGPSVLDAQWTGEQTDYEKNFGLDVAAMPPELQQKFWALSEWVRFGFGPRAYWTPMVAATIEVRTGVPLKNLEEAAMGLGTYSERDRVYAQQQLLAFEYGMDRMTEQSWRFVSAVVNDRLQSFYDDGRLWAVGGKPSRQAQEQIDRGEAPAGDTWFMGPHSNRTAQEVFVSEFSAFQAPPWRPESASQWAAERGKYIVSHPSLVPGAARQMRIQFQDLPPYFWAAASEDWSAGVIKYTLPSMGLLAYAIGRTGVALNSAQFLDDPDVQEVISRLSQQSFETATQEAFSPDRMLLVSEYTRMAQGNSDPEVKLHPWLALQLQGMLPGSVLEQPGRTTTVGANQTDSKFYLKGPLAAAWIGVPGSNDVNQLLNYISAPEDWVRAHGEISTSPEDWAKWKAWAEENAALGIDAVPTYPVDLPPDALWYYRALLLLGRKPRALTPEREAYYEVPKVQTEKPGIDTKRPNPITR